MEEITVGNLTFSYDTQSAFSLKNVSFSIEKGEIFLIIGESGCGKTTLLRHLKTAYVPQGIRSTTSKVQIAGKLVEMLTEREQASLVGYVRQNADAAQVTDKVWHELAFGLESLGYSQPVMQRKIAEMTAFFGLEGIYHEKLCNLSGGQRQLVNLASVMAMEPEVLVLDEPTSQLDPIASAEFIRMIEKIHREIGTTIVMTEHCLEDVYFLCDRVLVLDEGRVWAEGKPDRIAEELYKNKLPLYRALPAAARIYLESGQAETDTHQKESQGKSRIPFTVNEGRIWLENYLRDEQCIENAGILETEKSNSQKENKPLGEQTAVFADEVWFRYERKGKDILKACSIRIEQGKITAILGGNGAGKSTLLHVLAGHLKPYQGKIKTGGHSIGVLPQNPQAMFAENTVLKELEGQDIDAVQRDKVINTFGLKSVLNQHPFDLSGGQMQKLALAKLVLGDYDILLLDEPGKGMDYAIKEEMGEFLRKLSYNGKTILLVSHDVEFCAKYADDCGLFFDGHIVSFLNGHDFFLQNVFYTTAVSRICRGLLPSAVLLEDVLPIFGRKEEISAESLEVTAKDAEVSVNERNILPDNLVTEEKIDYGQNVPGKENRNSRMSWIRFVMFFLVMPVTIYFGHTVLQQRKYYFISLLLVLEAVLSFFLSFEKRKPKVREIMVVAVLSAITAAGRTAFYMVPYVKPMAALTILSGVGLGGEAGFLVGAMSMLVSNIFFGQGPWTPWQMFAMGILGFFAGVIFKRQTPCDKKKKFGICIYGLVAVLLVYGGIMNPASVLMYQENINLKMLLAAYGAGLPFDVIHGISTFIFLWIGARPMLEKIERIRKKL
ncbi:MAG: ATP-binding cassette domain-containing protein [Lachnospiraceae bacterium]